MRHFLTRFTFFFHDPTEPGSSFLYESTNLDFIIFYGWMVRRRLFVACLTFYTPD